MAISRAKAAEIAKRHGLSLSDVSELARSESEKEAEELAKTFAPPEQEQDIDAIVNKVLGR